MYLLKKKKNYMVKIMTNCIDRYKICFIDAQSFVVKLQTLINTSIKLHEPGDFPNLTFHINIDKK